MMTDSSYYPGPRHRSFALGEDGPGLLMIHGFPGTPAELLPLGEALAAKGRRVRAPRLPGFGADIASLGQRRRHDWLEAALEAYRALPPASSLLGYSMGGALAIALAARLVLLAPFWRMNDRRAALLPFLSSFVKTIAPFKDADFSRPALRASLADILPGADLSDAAVQARLRRELTLPTRALAEVYKLGRDAYREAPKVKLPTLIVQGRQDETVRGGHPQARPAPQGPATPARARRRPPPARATEPAVTAGDESRRRLLGETGPCGARRGGAGGLSQGGLIERAEPG